MPSLADSKSYNASFTLPKNPVAIFVGGTAGIGEAMARAFAQYTNGNAHIIIIGRNQSSAETLIASFPPPREGEGKHEFIKCDVTLMKNIYNTCEEILKRVSKINYLVLSAGLASFAPREDTKEGLERKLVIRYYSRWAFIDGLLPGLRAAKSQGEHASVLSVLAAGIAPPVDMDDLGLKKNYTGMRAMMQTSAYNDLMVAELAKREPDIAFTHMYPGFVRHSQPSIEGMGKMLYYIVLPIVWLAGKLMYPAESAEYMLYALFSGEKGMYRRDPKGKDVGMTKFPGNEEDQKKFWEHSAEEVAMAKEASR